LFEKHHPASNITLTISEKNGGDQKAGKNAHKKEFRELAKIVIEPPFPKACVSGRTTDPSRMGEKKRKKETNFIIVSVRGRRARRIRRLHPTRQQRQPEKGNPEQLRNCHPNPTIGNTDGHSPGGEGKILEGSSKRRSVEGAEIGLSFKFPKRIYRKKSTNVGSWNLPCLAKNWLNQGRRGGKRIIHGFSCGGRLHSRKRGAQNEGNKTQQQRRLMKAQRLFTPPTNKRESGRMRRNRRLGTTRHLK